MSGPRQLLARSDHPGARLALDLSWLSHFPFRHQKLSSSRCSGVIFGGRFLWHNFRRVAIAEPLFKAYCKQYGRRLRTGMYLHWIQGDGDIVIGDDVYLDGKCSISFAARFADRPLLQIGDHTSIGHNCHLTIGKEIRIGRHCLVATNVFMFDSSGHANDPESRRQRLPPADDQVRPITIEDDVWIGLNAIIFPGVTIGEGSIVCAGAVVMTDVPAYTIVAGNPARKILPGIRCPSRPGLMMPGIFSRTLAGRRIGGESSAA